MKQWTHIYVTLQDIVVWKLLRVNGDAGLPFLSLALEVLFLLIRVRRGPLPNNKHAAREAAWMVAAACGGNDRGSLAMLMHLSTDEAA